MYIDIYNGVDVGVCRHPLPVHHAKTYPPRVSCMLAFKRYCHYLYCRVYGIQTGRRGRGRIMRNSRAIVLQWCRLCRWGGQ